MRLECIVLSTALALPACANSELDNADTIETLSMGGRAELCAETTAVFSSPEVLAWRCASTAPATDVATCELERSRCLMSPWPGPLECELREGCSITVGEFRRCAKQLAGSYSKDSAASAAATCELIVRFRGGTAPPGQGINPGSCIPEVIFGPCRDLLDRCPMLFERPSYCSPSSSDVGRARRGLEQSKGPRGRPTWNCSGRLPRSLRSLSARR
jgi:hypothetical protein